MRPVSGPIRGTLRPPGSKSITNRALILAALAEGESRLTGVLDSVDTQVMMAALQQLGLSVRHDAANCECRIEGCGGRIASESADLWLENSGTSIRFLTALCAHGRGRYRLDGIDRMRQRPIGDLVVALNQLGGSVRHELEESDCPPLVIDGSGPLPGGKAVVAGSLSSQFLSALLMALPNCQQATRLQVEGTLVSVPYVRMTLRMMEDFGVSVSSEDNYSAFHIPTAAYRGRNYSIEPDASAASYFFAAAAITGGTVTVEGLSEDSLQGDTQFVRALERMGCTIRWGDDSVTVVGGTLQGIDIDMNAISDTAQTLAAVAVFAEGPTCIRNVEHMRHKETDRVTAVVTELRRAGLTVEESADGMRIHPGTPEASEFETYDDHRMAMSLSLLGLRSPGIVILDPECTAKTYPRFFEDLEALCGGAM